jgi:hypothetical protein
MLLRNTLLSVTFCEGGTIAFQKLCLNMSLTLLYIGGWLPNVEDESGSGAVHTSFYINVTMTLGNQSWRIGRRYSEFYKLYSTVYNKLCKAFPSGMQSPFPADRLVNWVSRTSQEEINDSRRKSLDSWFRELVNYPQIMLDQPTRKAIFEFLQVEQNLAKLKSAVISTQNPPPLPPRNRTSASLTTARQSLKTPTADTVPEKSRIIDPGSIKNMTSTEESLAFNNRRKAALAAQRNDYKSPPSDGPDALLKSEVRMRILQNASTSILLKLDGLEDTIMSSDRTVVYIRSIYYCVASNLVFNFLPLLLHMLAYITSFILDVLFSQINTVFLCFFFRHSLALLVSRMSLRNRFRSAWQMWEIPEPKSRSAHSRDQM